MSAPEPPTPSSAEPASASLDAAGRAPGSPGLTQRGLREAEQPTAVLTTWCFDYTERSCNIRGSNRHVSLSDAVARRLLARNGGDRRDGLWQPLPVRLTRRYGERGRLRGPERAGRVTCLEPRHLPRGDRRAARIEGHDRRPGTGWVAADLR